MPGTVAVYFVASPLQYLAARRIAERFEAGSRQVLVWYKPAVGPIAREEEWDAAEYMPWPRFEPLPGTFGRHRRLRANLQRVAQLAGPCETLHLHSAVFDTEAINYFLRGLPRLCGARSMHARILPDGLISIRRYPLNAVKRLLQYPRKLRRLFAPELDYWCFSGDRIGSDAPFCDRVYVLPGLPHEYPAGKVVELPPLVERNADAPARASGRRALVSGLPLVGGSPAVVRLALSPVWLLAVIVIGPLMSVLAVVFAIMVSSRVSDPRVAEQTAAVIIVPLLAVLFGQLAGVIVLNVTFMLVAIVFLALIDIAMVYLGARLFQREIILTRWK